MRSFVLLAVVLILAVGCSAARPGDPKIDGYAIGPLRTVEPGLDLRHVEPAARLLSRTLYPDRGFIDAFDIRSAGSLADGSHQTGVEGPATFLIVLGYADGGPQHALVIVCDPATAPVLDRCG